MTDPPTPTRIARHQDENAIYDLLIDLHRNNSRGWGYPYRPELLIRRIEAGTRPDPTTRSDPTDQLRGLIGVVDGVDGEIAASIGLFIEPAVWYSDMPCLRELWVYVRPTARTSNAPTGRQLHRSLFEFALWAWEGMRHGEHSLDQPGYPPFSLQTGFMYVGTDWPESLERLWRRGSGGQKIGVLFERR